MPSQRSPILGDVGCLGGERTTTIVKREKKNFLQNPLFEEFWLQRSCEMLSQRDDSRLLSFGLQRRGFWWVGNVPPSEKKMADPRTFTVTPSQLSVER